MKRHLFFRCNGGHYFRGPGCPYDGWYTDDAAAMVERFKALDAAGHDITVASLVDAHTSDELRGRIVLMEFSDEASVFDALVPERYIYDGEDVLLENVGRHLY